MYHNRILDVGPQFKITSQIDAKVELTDIEASVDVKYDLSGVSFVFPPQDSSQAGLFTPGANRESPRFTRFPHSANGSTKTDRLTTLFHQGR
jgi:hypothetical protein